MSVIEFDYTSMSRICVVCLAPSHRLLTEPGVEIMSVDYQIGKVDRTRIEVSGKRKSMLINITVYTPPAGTCLCTR